MLIHRPKSFCLTWLSFAHPWEYDDVGQHLALLSLSKPSATVDGFLSRAAVPARYQRKLKSFGACCD